jgi:hypothetical protein
MVAVTAVAPGFRMVRYSWNPVLVVPSAKATVVVVAVTPPVTDAPSTS